MTQRDGSGRSAIGEMEIINIQIVPSASASASSSSSRWFRIHNSGGIVHLPKELIGFIHFSNVFGDLAVKKKTRKEMRREIPSSSNDQLDSYFPYLESARVLPHQPTPSTINSRARTSSDYLKLTQFSFDQLYDLSALFIFFHCLD